MKKASAILLADIHLREDTPVCRTDDYFEAQACKITQVATIQREHGGIPILVAGDLFDAWKSSPNLLRFAVERLRNVIAIPGQHDLPNHSLKHFYKCNMAVPEVADRVRVLGVGDRASSYVIGDFAVTGYPWNTTLGAAPTLSTTERIKRRVALVHMLVYDGAGGPLWPGMIAFSGADVLKLMPGYDLIVTGDNHKPFIERDGDRLLVNPGSMMRMDADQQDYKPCLHLWYAEDNSVVHIPFNITPNVVSREHLDIKEERDNRLEKFVEQLRVDYKVGLSFEANLKQHFNANQIEPSVQDVIWEALKK